MQYQVLVENRVDGQFKAPVVGIPNCILEAGTQAEALQKAKTELEDRLAHSQLFTIEVAGAATNPWLEIAGSLRVDPTVDDWQAEIAEYRRQEDAKPFNQ